MNFIVVYVDWCCFSFLLEAWNTGPLNLVIFELLKCVYVSLVRLFSMNLASIGPLSCFLQVDNIFLTLSSLVQQHKLLF